MCLVTAVNAPKRTRGDDWALTLAVSDPSMQGASQVSLGVSIFRRQRDLLPVVVVGDVLVIEGFQIALFNGKKQAVSTKASLIFVAPPCSPGSVSSVSIGKTADREKVVISYLRKWTAGQSAVMSGSPSHRSINARPSWTTAQIQAGRFFDYIGEVICNIQIFHNYCLFIGLDTSAVANSIPLMSRR